jgi:hypothetical protein
MKIQPMKRIVRVGVIGEVRLLTGKVGYVDR